MEIGRFRWMFKNNNAIPLNDELVLWRKPLELWNQNTNEVIATFKTLEEALDFDLGMETIRELIERTEAFYFKYHGGRGAGSGAMGGGFGGNDGLGGNGFKQSLFNAEFNAINNADNSFDKTLKNFQDKYLNADHEFGIAVDDLGYVHKHIEGTSGAVAINGGKGQTIIHNHPKDGWGNFSDADLLSTAMGSEKGIVATGGKGTFKFQKNGNFKANEFAKAVKSAKWPTKYNYDQGADWWLKNNAKKYGYTYEGVFK